MAQRKLQTEIDRTFKRIDEGIAEFNDIWEKVHSTANANLKEKYEGDLKKEIKKLQRYRDQVKTWASSSEIKNKEPLMEQRRKIEEQMERFKLCEKEAKTKAYSKEGLAAASRRGKNDAVKNEIYEWIEEVQTKLQDQIDSFENEREAALGAGKKTKTKVSKDRTEKVLKLSERHKWHIEQLGNVANALQHDKVTSAQVQAIKDDVEIYIEQCQEPDFFEDEFLYDNLGDIVPDESDSDLSEVDSDSDDASSSKEVKETKDIVTPVAAKEKESAPLKEVKEKEIEEEEKKSSTAAPPKAKPIIPKVPIVPAKKPVATPPIVTPPIVTPTTGPTIAAIAAVNTTHAVQPKPLVPTPIVPPPVTPVNVPVVATTATPVVSATSPPAITPVVAPAKNMAAILKKKPVSPVLSPKVAPTVAPAPETMQQQLIQQQMLLMQAKTAMEDPNPSPLNLLEASLAFRPQPCDSERSKSYAPRNPYKTPACFPSVPANSGHTSSLVEKFNLDTLFFMFYFTQGSSQTLPIFNAAKELKKLSWRYHKNYLTWFQRHEEGKRTITEESEKGPYLYFDYEQGWCQRIKQDFVFDYKFLEDELQI